MLRIERLVEIVPAGRVFLVCGDIEHFAGNEFKLTDQHGVLADNAEGRDFSDRIDGGADTRRGERILLIVHCEENQRHGVSHRHSHGDFLDHGIGLRAVRRKCDGAGKTDRVISDIRAFGKVGLVSASRPDRNGLPVELCVLFGNEREDTR